MHCKKGVTIIELVLVIIILVLLAVIAIWSTANVIKKAEAAQILGEFKAVYTGAVQLQNYYNVGTIQEFRQGEHYCQTVTDSEGTWYVIYGLNHREDKAEYSDRVVRKWGLDELKRSYQVLLDNDEIKIKYYNEEYVYVGDYRILNYSDVLALQESGAF